MEWTTTPTDGSQVRRNDWMVLINQHAGEVQFNFYRVIETFPNASNPSQIDRVTLQGPDFDFIPDWDTLLDGNQTAVESFAVLLPDVIGVYERTFKLEPDSNYN